MKQKLRPHATFDRGRISLYLGDCIDGMSQVISPRSVDVVVTSPPYNIGKSYATHKDTMPREEYLAWMEKIGTRVKDLLKENGSYFLNIGNTPSDQWLPWDVALTLRKHFYLQNVIHWIKSIAISKEDAGRYPNIVGDIAVGHYKPISSSRFVNDCHEYIFHLTKTGDVELDKLSIGVPYQDKTNIGRWKKALHDKRDRGNAWFIPYETIQDRSDRPHPATFPPKLPEMCVKLHGIHGRKTLVVDPFLGIGSSAVAALRLGVSFVGFDIDKEYIKLAATRLRSTRN